MLRIDTTRRIKNAGRPGHKSAPGYLQWLRTRNCILTDTGECWGKVRACHWDQAGDKGMATKVADKFALPMCDGHHGEQTVTLGWPKFQLKYAFDASLVCAKFWSDWHGRAAWERDNG